MLLTNFMTTFTRINTVIRTESLLRNNKEVTYDTDFCGHKKLSSTTNVKRKWNGNENTVHKPIEFSISKRDFRRCE